MEQIYTCPMHPEVRKTAPGLCPGCGMPLIPAAQGQSQNHSGHNHGDTAHSGSGDMAKQMEKDMRRRFWTALVLAVPVFLISPAGLALLNISPASPQVLNWISLVLTAPIVFWSGSIFLTGTYYSLKSKQLNMAVLIATGVLAAYLFSVLLTIMGRSDSFYEAAALLVTFVLFGHWMEMRSRRGTSDALRALFNLVPPKAVVVREGAEVSVLTSEIIHGDIVVLKPGDKVPVDGKVISGETSIDESLVTGESMPVSKSAGDKVVGGSVNLNGSVRFEATQVGSETVLAQIIALVEKAQNSKAPGQRIADRAAGWLVLVAIGSGLLTFFGWYFFAGAGLIAALTFAVSTVVIACPDALGLATPTAVAVGTGIGAKHNILIKDAATLENASRITAIVLDKTGTLTAGKPKVTDIFAVQNYSREDIISLAASAEGQSNHPLAKAILDKAGELGAAAKAAEKFEYISGRGIKAVIAGRNVLVGTEKFVRESGADASGVIGALKDFTAAGKTISVITVDGKAVGVVAAADMVKPNAARAVMELKKLGIETVMITGDHAEVAAEIGREVGVDRIFAEVLPEQKAEYVKKLQAEGKFVAMVGDGINDAPALAQADIGIAIGAGTDVAIETGSIVLMKSDPYDILAAIRLSKATVLKMKQNLFWAAIYNILAIPVAAGVFYRSFGLMLKPEISALLMSASSIIVATNAVLLKKVKLHIEQ